MIIQCLLNIHGMSRARRAIRDAGPRAAVAAFCFASWLHVSTQYPLWYAQSDRSVALPSVSSFTGQCIWPVSYMAGCWITLHQITSWYVLKLCSQHSIPGYDRIFIVWWLLKYWTSNELLVRHGRLCDSRITSLDVIHDKTPLVPPPLNNRRTTKLVEFFWCSIQGEITI